MAHWSASPVLRARDVAAAVDYYTKVLGFRCPMGPIPGVDAAEGPIYAVLDRHGAGLHLQIRRQEAHAATREKIAADAYFYVDDAVALEGEFARAGARFHRRLVRDNPYGLVDFIVEDLDGNRLVFGSPKG
jgi:catechol 2,3-dioxygenase-like lactoylglutathione lyase family enzyme